MQRVHWDPQWARNAGNPTTYDYGRMRETWLIHLCTDWMGDDAWLWKLECEFRGFNYVGDTHHLTGTIGASTSPTVTGPPSTSSSRHQPTRRRDHPGHGDHPAAEPEHGPVRLPDPPAARPRASLVAVGDAFSRR